MRPQTSTKKVLRQQINWKELFFYQKTDVLYQLTVSFCKRFLPIYGDRTVDQMIQAARSGKQNIVEGLADGVTSAEMQLKLLNVARASIQELREDYYDRLTSQKLLLWDNSTPRYDAMLKFCREHNKVEDYKPFFEQWSCEEMANIGYTLCRIVDKMMMTFLEILEAQFVTEGGIKERMYAARTGYRAEQDNTLRNLKEENEELKAQIAQLKEEVARLRGRN